MISRHNIVFTATNQHTAHCGTPPDLTNGEVGKYYGYFENEFGEQWVLVYDPKERRGVLRGGDADWENKHDVIDGQSGIILGRSEQAWLKACLEAADARHAVSS